MIKTNQKAGIFLSMNCLGFFEFRSFDIVSNFDIRILFITFGKSVDPYYLIHNLKV